MPYRTDLKRPDLKGQFPCSVCNKIFCHSSSLSRHRMQAHYKSYTCTQCNQDIHNSENLRSHMYRCHQIHRMFMCRCCNWAFPDKTSLHIHMQSMQKSGKPGDVSVLARSSLDPDVKLAFPDSDGSTTNSCPEDDSQIFPEESGEISELEEQQQLLKNENNNIIREQSIKNNNNFISDENNLKKEFLPSPQNIQQTTGIFPQQNQQQQQRSFVASPNVNTTEMFVSKLGGIINGEEKQQQQQHLLQNIVQTNPNIAQTLLAIMQNQNSHPTPQQQHNQWLLHLLANNPYLLSAATSPAANSTASILSNDYKQQPNIILQNQHFHNNHLPISSSNISSTPLINSNVLQSLCAAVAASAAASTSNSSSSLNNSSITKHPPLITSLSQGTENIKKKNKINNKQPLLKKRRGEKRKSSNNNNNIIKNKNINIGAMPTMDLSLQILQKQNGQNGVEVKAKREKNEAKEENNSSRCESLSPSMGKLNSLITNLLAIKGGGNNNIKKEHSPIADDDINNGGDSSSASERRNKRKMRTPARAAEEETNATTNAVKNEKNSLEGSSDLITNEENNNLIPNGQPSPAVSDSQTSSGGTTSVNGTINNDEPRQQKLNFEAVKDDTLSNICSSCQELKARFGTQLFDQSLTKLFDDFEQMRVLSQRIISLLSPNNEGNNELFETAQKLHQLLTADKN